MCADDATSPGRGQPPEQRRAGPELIPREYLRVIAVWSLVPSYLVAGGLIGWFADQALHTFPYITGGLLVLALVMATRDMLRLRDMM